MDERLVRANTNLPTINIKGKNYIMVKDRVKAFRKEFEGWSILTEIVADDGKEVTVKTSVLDAERNIVATGHASEIRGAGNINKVSALENCESSSIGRALGNLGIGIDDSFGSADEVGNAISQQNKPAEKFEDERISAKDAKNLRGVIEMNGFTVDQFTSMYEVNSLEELTKSQYRDAVMRATPQEKNVIKA